MDINTLKEHVDTRLDRIEEKLDSHMDRLARTETHVENLQGNIKLIVAIIVGSVTGIIGLLYKKLFG